MIKSQNNCVIDLTVWKGPGHYGLQENQTGHRWDGTTCQGASLDLGICETERELGLVIEQVVEQGDGVYEQEGYSGDCEDHWATWQCVKEEP